MKIKSTIILLLIISFFIGCNSCKNKNDEVIKIGAILSMTGDVGAYGMRSKKGIELAAELINENGGIRGKKLEIIYEDAKSSPKDALTAFEKLTNSDKVRIIVGDVYSSTTMAVVPRLDETKTILLAPGASNPKLSGVSKYFIRNWVSDDFDGFVMANYLMKNDIKNINVIVQISDYTLGLFSAFEKEFIKLGGIITSAQQFKTDENDFKSIIRKVKDTGINNVYIISQAKQMGNILKQSYELNFKPNWFSNLTVNTPECESIAGISRNGITFTSPSFNVNATDSSTKQFVNKFKDKYGELPEETSGHSYDLINILVSAIKNNGDNVETLIKYINAIKNFPGVTGITTFKGNGDVIKDISIYKIENDSAKFISKFISSN